MKGSNYKGSVNRVAIRVPLSLSDNGIYTGCFKGCYNGY